MTWSDAIKIIFGAAIGLGISECQAWFSFRRAQKRSEKLLRVQIPRLLLSMKSLKTVHLEHQVIKSTELPSLNFIGSNEIAALPVRLAELVIDLDDLIKGAEMSRIIATSNFANHESPEFHSHNYAYGEYLQVTIDRLEAISEYLQSHNSVSIQNVLLAICRRFCKSLERK